MINQFGYGIKLNTLSEDDLNKLKDNLTVKPDIMADYDYGQIEPFSVYRTSETRIYVPKYYGLKKTISLLLRLAVVKK